MNLERNQAHHRVTQNSPSTIYLIETQNVGFRKGKQRLRKE